MNASPNAFQVTARTCATGYYSFSHEFGHLFGCHHDKANGGTAYYPYGYGWRTANGLWRTVMAYAPGTRINYWSNPNKIYSGQALGVVNQAENYRALNNNAWAISQWRCAKTQNYCQGKFTSSLLSPFMGSTGKPIANGTGGFLVSILGAEPNKSALAFFGYQTNNTPFLNGTLCVADRFFPLYRYTYAESEHLTELNVMALFQMRTGPTLTAHRLFPMYFYEADRQKNQVGWSFLGFDQFSLTGYGHDDSQRWHQVLPLYRASDDLTSHTQTTQALGLGPLSFFRYSQNPDGSSHRFFPLYSYDHPAADEWHWSALVSAPLALYRHDEKGTAIHDRFFPLYD